MNESAPRTMDNDDVEAVLAMVPTLLHFTPTNSLIMVGLTGKRSYRVAFVARVDLPDPACNATVLSHLEKMRALREIDAVAVVIVGGTDDQGDDDVSSAANERDFHGSRDEWDLPHRELVDGCTELAQKLNLPVLAALWVPELHRGRRWFSFTEPGQCGVLPDLTTTLATVMAIVGGQVIYADRDALVAQVKPDPATELARRQQLIHHQPPIVVEQAIAFLHDVIARANTDETVLDDEAIARLAHGLTHPQVFDAALSLALTDSAANAERLWTYLTRSTPCPHRARPASLLSLAAYLRGDGVLARVAAEAAVNADPSNELANLMSLSIDRGLRPNSLRDMLAEAVAAEGDSSSAPF